MNVTDIQLPISDPWNIGTLHKPSIWSFYFLSNYLGVCLCSLMIYFVTTNSKRSASDIIIVGLGSGCISMSFTCGTQCLLNLIAGRFYGGVAACQIEAVAHISSVLTEFFSVMFTFVAMYYDKVKKSKIEQRTAIIIVVTTWLVCTIVTLLLSLVSPIYLMSSGAYCFFGFSSAAIALWLVPGLVISLGTSAFYQYKTFNFYGKMLANNSVMTGNIKAFDGDGKVITMRTKKHIWLAQFRWRSIIFLIILLIGWGFAAVTTIYELAVGQATEWLVTAVGVGGVSFSWWVPLTFFYTSPYYKERFISLLCCRSNNDVNRLRSLSKIGDIMNQNGVKKSSNASRLSRAEKYTRPEYIETAPVQELGVVKIVITPSNSRKEDIQVVNIVVTPSNSRQPTPKVGTPSNSRREDIIVGTPSDSKQPTPKPVKTPSKSRKSFTFQPIELENNSNYLAVEDSSKYYGISAVQIQ